MRNTRGSSEKELTRALQPARPADAAQMIADQVALKTYGAKPRRSSNTQEDGGYQTNKSLWRDILQERARANCVLTLNKFTVSEWIPRSPGLFHTGFGEASRAKAWSERLTSANDRGAPRYRRRTAQSDLPVIFNPRGKMSMINGGVGCVRLQPLVLRGQEYWMLGATSSGVSHEGITVAVPDSLYEEYSDLFQVGLYCSIKGRLRLIKNDIVGYYSHGVPRVYLEAEVIDPIGKLRRRGCLVCAAVSFRGIYENEESLYATYASFNSGNRTSLEEAVEWIEAEYVRRKYQGKIVTDFDEQSGKFANATFSISNILSDQVTERNAKTTVLSVSDARGSAMVTELLRNVRTIKIERVEMKIINIGDGATINAPIAIADQIQGSFNMVAGSNADGEAKMLLGKLLQAVSELAAQLPDKDAKLLARDAQDIVKEASNDEPRPEICKSLLDRLATAAKGIGEIATPLAAVVGSLLKLYGGGG